MLMGNASKILQTVSANIDRDVVKQALLQLVDLILLTDTTGLLTGEEQLSVQGVNVAVQRETQRQRQHEFLQATNNPTDMSIVGIKGRGEVLRSVANTIGMPGERIVPSEQALEQMAEAQKKQQANGGGQIERMIQEAVDKGVAAGVQRISTELSSGTLASRMQLPEGAPVHLGTPPPGATPQPATNDPNIDLAHNARQSMGSKPSKLTTNHMGPHLALTGNQPEGAHVPFHGGAT
jgi:hypothetical protein